MSGRLGRWWIPISFATRVQQMWNFSKRISCWRPVPCEIWVPDSHKIRFLLGETDDDKTLWFTMVYYGKPHHRIFCVPYMKQQVYCRNYVKQRLQRMVWHGHKSMQSIWVLLPHTIWLIFEYLPSNAKHGAHTSNNSREVRGSKGST